MRSRSTACLPPPAPRPSLIGIQGHAIGLFMEKLEPKSMGKAGEGVGAAAVTFQWLLQHCRRAACDGTILAHSMPFVLWGFSELNIPLLPFSLTAVAVARAEPLCVLKVICVS